METYARIGQLLQSGGKDYLDNRHIILPDGSIYERTTKDTSGWIWVKIN